MIVKLLTEHHLEFFFFLVLRLVNMEIVIAGLETIENSLGFSRGFTEF